MGIIKRTIFISSRGATRAAEELRKIGELFHYEVVYETFRCLDTRHVEKGFAVKCYRPDGCFDGYL